jgi:class 3 adenylate cyclase
VRAAILVADSRKTVTAVFIDVTGSTRMGQRLDPEAMRAIMEEFFAVVSAVLVQHGGTVEKYVGDAVMAVFGVPVAHEDDALRACRAAVQMVGAVDELGRRVEGSHGMRFGIRVGVETGEVVVGDLSRGSTFASGPVVNIAARLEQAANDGECLVGPECYALVRDRVVVEDRGGLMLKGVDQEFRAYRLAGLSSGAGRRQQVGAFLGRSRELGLLHQAFDCAVGDRTCQLVTVLGPAGIGKSRLVDEFLAEVDGNVMVLRGTCVSYGDGVSYWPLVEAVRQAAGLTGAESAQDGRNRLTGVLAGSADADAVVGHLGPIAGLGGDPGTAEDAAWAVQRLLDILAAERPIILVVDDLHWADPGLVALLDSVCTWSRDAPILVLVLARTEFLEDQPQWGADRPNAVSAPLEPLRDAEAADLAADLAGGELPVDAADRVLAAAGGNPLFVQQLLAMLVEDGALQRVEGRWTLGVDLAQLRIPTSITAVLNARLDRLSAAERTVLGAASVIGQVFYPAAVEILLAGTIDIAPPLHSLLGKGLIMPATSDLPGQPALRITHILAHECAYGALPKAARAVMHERFARWLDRHFEGQSYDDFVGGHLEAAYHCRAALGSLDDSARRLGQEAAARLGAAARLVLFVDDDVAMRMLERADSLRTDDGPDRWAQQLELARAHLRHEKNLPSTAALIDSIRRNAEQAGDERWAALARIVQAQLQQHFPDHPEATETLNREATQALTLFAANGDPYGLALAHSGLGDVALMRTRWADLTQHLTLAADNAERAGRHREAQLSRLTTLIPMMNGDCPADIGLTESIRLRVVDDRFWHALTEAVIGFFATLLGMRETADASWQLSERLARELRAGVTVFVAVTHGTAAMAVGDWADAAQYLEQVCDLDRRNGNLTVLSTDAALLAHALLHKGEFQLARAQVATAKEFGVDDDAMTEGYVHSADAWLAAHDGDLASWHREREIATSSLVPEDCLLQRALIHEACAEAALLTGDTARADVLRRKALDLQRAKGNVASVQRLQAVL